MLRRTGERDIGVNIYYVPTASMVPAIMPGSLVLVDLKSYASASPQEGDVVTFTLPSQPERVLIKRIAEIETIRDGQHYYLIGDNPEQSFDSRHFGWIEQRHIKGKIALSFSP